MHRIIASVRELEQLPATKALKFHWKKNIDGFVFLKENSPIAFVNRCSHIALEMDMNDSDFFAYGVIQCKVHGAMFDPDSGLCLRSPPNCKMLHPLRRIDVSIDGDNVILAPPGHNQHVVLFDDAYRKTKQKQLQERFNTETLDIKSEIDAINERSLRLIQGSTINPPKKHS